MQSFTAILILGLAAATMAEFNIMPKPDDFVNGGAEGAKAIHDEVGAGVHRIESEGDRGVHHPEGVIRDHGDVHKREASPYSYYYPYYNYPSYGYRSYYPYSALSSSMYPYSSYRLSVPSTKGYSYYYTY